MAHTTTQQTIAEYLEAHPRMMGALFTICLLLMETGNAAAAATANNGGP